MREGPSLEDYLATGALANVPLWVFLLLLSFDVYRYTESNPIFFYTVIPIVAMTGGGFVASYLMFRRVRKHTFRSGLLFGVSATIVNLVFGVATSAPSTPFVGAICFLAGAVLGVMLWRKKDKELESVT
jgi:peptidoglycan/LPS O-acetylase OafA/YrhL